MKQFTDLHKEIIQFIKNSSVYKKFIEKYHQKESFSISGLEGSSFSFFVANVFNLKERDLLILCKNENESEKIRDDLDFIIGVDQIAFLPDEIETNSKEENQIFSFFLNDVLAKIHTNRKNIFITTKEGLESKFPNNDFLSENSYILKINKEIERDELEEILMSFGYKREEMVLYPKDFCVKGSIIDFFPPDRTYPIRIEFFDNIIESMRIFDIEDQISISHLEKYILKPPADSKIAKENATSLFHLLKKDLLVIQNNIDEFDKPLFDTLSGYQKISNYDLFESDLNFDFIHHDLKKNDFKTSKALLNNFVKFQDKKLCIIGNTEEQINKINHLLEIDPIEYVIGNISSGFEFLDHKFIIIPEHEIFKKERQSRSFRNLPKDFNIEKFDIDKVEHGDKMVHEDYGIGEFERMEIISAFGAEKECIVLKYAGDSRVYVPMDKIFKVKKYKATDGIEPQLTTLNSGEWERKKLRTKKSLEKITRELMELYAKRLQTKGYAFEPDTEIQMEMEMEFPWEETPDQISATQEIKNDMESVKPMDRLLCGDVGFGKTEVAIRAAFKAVSNSKQVAILVPTTILSDQHFKSFSDRLRNYPVKIEKLSRFVTAKLQKTIIRDIREGKVDIVISTSKILSKNIEFKDLGLLIIDEEHQFGVKQKEHIKNLAKNIDVLSLTATPIPRTLHFSLIGARDYSQINTPPKFRLPIITEIIRFKEETIIKAVKREIERNGQIYFVHNEIQSIQQVSIKLMEMFPDLKIQWAHGQMKEQELEPIMYDFINQKIDILVTTSIIESGIDIPNVNTIFINNANRFGLAQLYQLRGRVGRTNRRAYCYLITPGISKLNTDAVKRLKTIKRYTSLGSGYSIAMRDLEIRGSGNVFGVEQKGNIQSIGYDLYIKMLKTVMNELKEKEFNEELIDKILNSDSKPPTDIIYPKAAYFSQEYIEVQSLRLNFYKRLAGIQSVEDLENLKKEIMDRFGEPNKQALRLFEITKIKYFAEQIGTRRIIFNGNEVKLEFDKVNILGDDNPKIFTSISEICSDLGVSFRFIPDDNLKMILRIPEKELDNTKQFLDKLYQKFKL